METQNSPAKKTRCPINAPPTDEEIAALADQFRPLWRQNRTELRPWLRKHGEALMQLVHDDWSWDSVAAALNRAGITYQTGNPWTGYRLRRNCLTAKTPLKFGANRIARTRRGARRPKRPRSSPPPAPPMILALRAAQKNRNRFPSSEPALNPRYRRPLSLMISPISARPAQNVEAVLARFTGENPRSREDHPCLKLKVNCPPTKFRPQKSRARAH